MENQKESVKVVAWILGLVNWESSEPVFYYNTVEDKFERQFSNQCAYLSEKDCEKKEKELNIDGLQVIKGTMDYPKEVLIDSIMSTFVEAGLIKNHEK